MIGDRESGRKLAFPLVWLCAWENIFHFSSMTFNSVRILKRQTNWNLTNKQRHYPPSGLQSYNSRDIQIQSALNLSSYFSFWELPDQKRSAWENGAYCCQIDFWVFFASTAACREGKESTEPTTINQHITYPSEQKKHPSFRPCSHIKNLCACMYL